jgi:hypothetical protein
MLTIFEANRIPGEPEDSVPYWRDVGTIEAYYEANMDLTTSSTSSTFTIASGLSRSTSYPDPPAKFVFDEEERRGEALDSIVSGGCIVSGGLIRWLSPRGKQPKDPIRRVEFKTEFTKSRAVQNEASISSRIQKLTIL